MDRHLKERLIGAIVLVAAAIILIPEMLSGPRAPVIGATESSVTSSSSAPKTDGGKFKTYTIDLAKAATPVAVADPTKSEKFEKPADVAKPSAATSPPPDDSTSVAAVPSAELKPPAEESKPPAVVSQSSAPPRSKPEETAAAKPAISKAPPARVANADSGWAVQVGSFSARATSDRLAGELKQSGFPSYVVAFQSGSQTMYRVRVGPARDRAAAEVLLNKVKSQHPTATLVPPS